MNNKLKSRNFLSQFFIDTAKTILPTRLVWAYRYLKYPHKFTIVGGNITYHKDGMAILHSAAALKEPLLAEAYQKGRDTGSWLGYWGDVDPEWRSYVACWAALKGKSLEGDFVECGVNKGGMSRAAMHYIDFENIPDKKFYLLDTFKGTPREMLGPQEQKRNIYDECYDEVLKTFSSFKNAVIVRGEVPGTLSQVSSKKVCYLSIDMNAAIPEIAAAEYFWDKLSSGAVMVLDDYGGIGYETQQIAFDKFAKEKNVQVLSLPTGQGLIFKP